ncbi:MAG TPA: MFS transporter [Steroidobacteraceae bacterium]
MHVGDAHAEQLGRPGWVRSYVVTVIAMMAIQASSLGFSPLIPYMKDAWHMSYTQMGTFTGLYGLVALLMSVPAGLLAKRFGEKPVMITGLLLASVGLAVVALANSFLQGVAARTVWLIGYRLAFICVVTAVSLTVPSRWRGKSMGLLGALTAFATVLGSGFSNSMQGMLGWRLSMMGFGLMTLIGAVVMALGYRGAQAAAPLLAARPRRNPFSAFKVPIVWVIPLLGLSNAPGFAATFFVPAVVRGQLHGTPAQASGIIAAAYGVAIIANPVCGWLTDRFERWWVLAGMCALMVPACALMSSTDLYVFAGATAALVALGHAAANQIYPTAAELLRGRDTGPIMGIVGLGSGLFGYLGPQALGWMRDYSGGFDLGWHVIMGTTLGVIALMLWLRQYLRQHAGPASAAA